MPTPDSESRPSIDEQLLPLGVHRATMDEVESQFVDGFAGSSTRREIFEGMRSFRTFIRGIIPDIDQEFVDGSFVTGRENPNDVDMSIWVHADILEALPADRQNLVEQLFGTVVGREYLKKQFRCDPYIVPYCEVGHRMYVYFINEKTGTEKYWARYKDPIGLIRGQKGYLELVEQ